MINTYFIYTVEKPNVGRMTALSRNESACDVAGIPLMRSGGDGKVVAHAGQQWGEFKPKGEHVIAYKVEEYTERGFWDWIHATGYEGIEEKGEGK